MIAVVIYFAAGLSLAWSYNNDSLWRRAVMVLIWPGLICWGMSVQAIEWWRFRGYVYEDDEDEEAWTE